MLSMCVGRKGTCPHSTPSSNEGELGNAVIYAVTFSSNPQNIPFSCDLVLLATATMEFMLQNSLSYLDVEECRRLGCYAAWIL
jgi:hypothetical protein